jgi:hypothetical protein
MARLARGLVRIVRESWLVLLVLAAAGVAFLALRTPASDVGSVAEVDAVLNGGQPALVEFYSNT